MRNLTIKRTKRFAGCLATMKVYIEDNSSDEIRINDIPCRKLGTLKNGEEKIFQIGDEAAKVFVIADKLTKNYCNEFYQLPEGSDDIYLTGQNKLDPAVGNAFRFDNNNNEETIVHRKRNKVTGTVVFICAIVVGFLVGFFVTPHLFPEKEPEVKAFSAEGMTITLTDSFSEGDFDGFTAVYGSRDVVVLTLREGFELMEGLEDYTLDQYLDLVLQANGLSEENVKRTEGLTSFVYDFTNPETNENFRYFSYVYKADDAFWTIQFAVLSDKADEHEQQIIQWASSVEFAS
ncbi:MAG: hypothetical protein E7665_11080 [Ruminococcaceae bacterium]|nr:hypothetical protein [Oscillospiraceae bacterium]